MSKEKVIQEIGARLLRGETMCKECCPFGCNCPLMESVKDGLVCVSCLKRFKRDALDGVVEIVQQNAPITEKVSERKSEPERKPVDEDTKPNPVASRMLEGWTMLGISCPLCFNPLVKSPVDNT